jgi:hypothetical protein
MAGLFLGDTPIGGGGGGESAGQVFTTSGTWEVPAGVTFVYAIVRGGNGGDAGTPGQPGTNQTLTSTGSTGGTSTFASITSPGGAGGFTSYFQNAAGNAQYSHGRAGRSATAIEGIVTVIPEDIMDVVIGSGAGAYVSIMWRVP